MATPAFSSDQLFTITSVAYPTQAANLVGGYSSGPIDGNQLATASSQLWKFDNGIKNYATGTYAGIQSAESGAELFGSETLYPWGFIPTGVPDVFQIATKDKRFVWVLQSGYDYTTITILPANEYTGPNAQWLISPTEPI